MFIFGLNTNMKIFSASAIPLFLFIFILACEKEPTPEILFNGLDLNTWDTYLGVPDRSQEVAGLSRDAQGNYTEAFGLNNDPLGIFSVVEEDGVPAIRIDGYVWGCLVTRAGYANYHLHLEYKWGELKHPPRENLERNSGLCYHSVGPYGVFQTYWMRSFELEIKENALGDFVRVDEVYGTVETRVDTMLTSALRLRYQEGGHPVEVSYSTYMIRAREDFEKPHGEWNVIDLYTLDDAALHVINGELVMVVTQLQQDTEDGRESLTAGKIQLQSEGAEIFYRDIWITPISAFPEYYLKK